jgi:hypothetical protein
MTSLRTISTLMFTNYESHKFLLLLLIFEIITEKVPIVEQLTLTALIKCYIHHFPHVHYMFTY